MEKQLQSADFQSSTFDYAIISAPFTVVRQWRLPLVDVTMINAIKNLNYDTCCKVAREYSERFWEKLKNPIYGSCDTDTGNPGIAFACYPSYNINSTGQAAILGTYLEGSVNHEISKMMSMSDDEHVQYVLDAMCEIHGEHTRSSTLHELYIPEYFKVHKNLIFVGEHTSYTHGWVSSALDSGIRGGVQMLLELGLVDEAKAAVKKWINR